MRHTASRVDEVLPPGPRLPKAVQTVLFLRRAQNGAVVKWHERFGDTFTVRLVGGSSLVVLVDSQAIREVFTGSAEVFHAPRDNPVAPILGSRSVFLLNEDEHLRARKMLMPAFNGAALRGYAEMMADIARSEVRRWPVGTPLAVQGPMSRFTLEVILRVVFGIAEGPRLDRMRGLIDRLMTAGPMTLAGWDHWLLKRLPPWTGMRAVLRRIDDLLYAEIAERRRQAVEDRTDVLSRLLAADSGATDVDLRDNLLTLLLAGHETTATALAWLLHDLAHNPEVRDRTWAAGDAGDSRYLQAVIKEGLRRRTLVAPVARELSRPTTIGGYLLPAGMMVAPYTTLVHLNPADYPDPDRFRPERFLDGSVDGGRWLPFGGGLRRCIGAGFSMQESEVMLRAVIRAFEVHPGGPEERPKARNVTAAPSKGGRITLTPRSS
ncbi:cytochrome P450 [Actinokineospora sp. 24-640]